MDALFRKYATGTNAEAEAISEYSARQGRAFQRDWLAAEARVDGVAVPDAGIDSEELARANQWPTKFSQGRALPEGQGVPLERAQQVVQAALTKLGLAGRVNIEVHRRPGDFGVTPPDGVTPAGATLGDGRIAVFSDFNPDAASVFRTVFHELFHAGLSRTAGGAYLQQMARFALDPLVRTYATRWKDTPDGRRAKAELATQNYEALAVEEALANVAEDMAAGQVGTREMNRFVRAITERLAQLAQFVGLGGVAQQLRRMTYSDAERFVMETLRGSSFDAPTPPAAPGPGTPAPGTRFRQMPQPEALRRPAQYVSTFLNALKDGKDWTLHRLMFTEDLLNVASRPGSDARLASAAEYKSKMATITVELEKRLRNLAGVWQNFVSLSEHERGTTPTSVNGVLMASTLQKEWAFAPDWLPADSYTYNPDSTVAKNFRALSSPAARDMVVQVFRHAHTSLQDLRKVTLEKVTSEYDAAIAGERAQGHEEAAVKLEQEKLKHIQDVSQLLLRPNNWPYAPLKRFGKYVVVGVSQRYADVATAVSKSPHDKALRAEFEALQADPAHYYVGFAETKRQARKEVEAVGAETGLTMDFFERTDEDNMLTSGRDMLSAFQRLRNVVNDTKGLDDNIGSKLDATMRGLYLQILSDTSVRKAELERKGVAGADKDMMRSFISQGQAQAHYIANLSTVGDVNDLLHNMRREASRPGGNRTKRMELFNEILRRHEMNLDYTDTPIIDRLLAVTSVYMLLSNPSYYMLNLTQPWMMSLPMLAAKHGYTNAANQLLKSYKDILPAIKDGSFRQDDYSKLPADVKEAIEALANRDRIEISLEIELGKARSEVSTGMETFERATGFLRNAAQSVEATNRLATAIAAYRMERQAILGRKHSAEAAHSGAVDYAEKVLYETHGSYTAFNAPRFMRTGLGRVATQFRKFQLIQASMFARFLHDAFKGESAEVKATAKAALAFNLAHLVAFAGVMGLPGFTAIAFLIGAAWDNDEPDDPEATLRRAIGDNAVADLLLRGLPKTLGLDISDRVGAGSMLSLMPFADVGTSREGYAEILMGALGPSIGGMLPRLFDGVSQMRAGNLWQGMELMLPGALGNSLRGYRFATEGVTNRAGDLMLPPEDIHFTHGVMQALGLPTNILTDRRFLNAAQFRADQFYTARTTRLKRAYTEAYNAGDGPGKAAVLEDWKALQEARKRVGFSVQPLSTLLRAPQEQRAREASVVDGVRASPRHENFTQLLTE